MGAETSKSDAGDIAVHLKGRFGHQKVVVHTSQELGTGSYGSVVKATLDGVPSAAKIIHRIFIKSDDPGLANFIARFEQECEILRSLKHPCIVQFLGVVQDPSTKKPILLMEMMKESLTTFLESSPTDIPYHVQVNISHDIALAIAHLHRNGIIHRNLSSNNILLNDIHQAKVTDFGMSKIADANPSMTRSRVTQCPGTLAYMPPEALRVNARYSDKLDTFSTGVLLVQIITCKFPSPTDAEITRADTSSPSGVVIIPVPEMERRRADIDKVPAGHTLLPIARNCLKDKSQERPTAAQLCQSLGELKDASAYKESVKNNTTYEGRTELHAAAERGDVKTVQRLIATAVDIDSRTKDDGLTALHLASERGHVAVVRLLIQAHAVIDLQCKAGRTPLYYASWKGHVAVVQLLLQNNADVSIYKENGCSPLYVASEYGHTEIVDLLVRAGADVNQATESQRHNR